MNREDPIWFANLTDKPQEKNINKSNNKIKRLLSIKYNIHCISECSPNLDETDKYMLSLACAALDEIIEEETGGVISHENH